MARVIAVASAKGGVGKTTTTAALGATLAETGVHVVAVDADLGMANLGTAVGVDPGADEATVHDVLAGRADVADATYEGPAGLSVVPGDTDLAAFPDADPSKLRSVLEAFDDADYVLLDTGAGLSHDTVLPLGLADEVVLVTDTTPNAVGDTEKTRQVVDRVGGSVAGVVVTQVDSDRTDGEGDGIDSIEGIDAPVLATVPASPVVAEAAAADDPLSVSDPTSAVAAAYRQLARELTDEQILEPDVEDAETPPADVSEDGHAADGDDTAVDDESEAEADDSDERVEDGEETDEDDTESGDNTPDEDDPDTATTDEDAVDALVPDAESDVSTADTATDDSDERVEDGTDDTTPEEGVYTTPLVDEAESNDGSAEPAGDAETQTDEEDGDDERSGFLGRLLG